MLLPTREKGPHGSVGTGTRNLGKALFSLPLCPQVVTQMCPTMNEKKFTLVSEKSPRHSSRGRASFVSPANDVITLFHFLISCFVCFVFFK